MSISGGLQILSVLVREPESPAGVGEPCTRRGSAEGRPGTGLERLFRLTRKWSKMAPERAAA